VKCSFFDMYKDMAFLQNFFQSTIWNFSLLGLKAFYSYSYLAFALRLTTPVFLAEDKFLLTVFGLAATVAMLASLSLRRNSPYILDELLQPGAKIVMVPGHLVAGALGFFAYTTPAGPICPRMAFMVSALSGVTGLVLSVTTIGLAVRAGRRVLVDTSVE